MSNVVRPSDGAGATWVHRDGRVWKNGKYYTAEEWGSYVPPPPEEEPDPCERPSAYTGKGFYENWEIVAAENRANAKQHLKYIGEEIAWSAAAGPIGWVGRGAGKIGFKSFRAFKRAMGPAGEGRVWHHIVEKRASNIERFGAEAIHNTENVVNVPCEVNQTIANYYSSKDWFTNGKTVREWLDLRSYEEQMAFGKWALDEAINNRLLR